MMKWRRRGLARRLSETPIEWHMSFDLDDDVPTLRAIVKGKTYKLRMNPPGEVRYTLVASREKVADFPVWPAAWVRAGEKEPEPEESGPSVEPGLLELWAEALCRTTSDDPSEIGRALGIDILPGDGEQASAQPPPAGTNRLTVGRHPVGFVYVEMDLTGNEMVRAQLDALFGEGRSLPRIHPDSDHTLSYRVGVPGAPFACGLFASFRKEPSAEVSARRIMLRRDPTQ